MIPTRQRHNTLVGDVTSIVLAMNVRRRERGSLQDPHKVGLTLEQAADNRLAAMAEAAGVSKSQLTQWLIESAPLDERGRPLAWDGHDEENLMTG